MISNIRIRKICGEYKLLLDNEEYDITDGELERLFSNIKTIWPQLGEYKKGYDEGMKEGYEDGFTDGLKEAVWKIERGY